MVPPDERRLVSRSIRKSILARLTVTSLWDAHAAAPGGDASTRTVIWDLSAELGHENGVWVRKERRWQTERSRWPREPCLHWDIVVRVPRLRGGTQGSQSGSRYEREGKTHAAGFG